MTINVDDMDLAGLSEEERAALIDDDETGAEASAEEEQPAVEARAEEEETVEAEAAPEPAPVAEPEKAVAEEKAEAEPEPALAKEKPERLSGDVPDHKLVAADLPEDFNDKLSAVDTQLDALYEQHDLGDLSYKEMKQAERSLLDERHNLIRMRDQAEFVQQNNAASWEATAAAFMKSNADLNNPIMEGAMSAALNALYQDQPGQTWSYYLNEAASQVRSAFGMPLSEPAKQEAPEPAKQAAPAPKDGTKSALESTPLPTTLGGVPEASADPIQMDEYASLDSIDGLELEAAIARMSPEQQEKYLRAVS